MPETLCLTWWQVGLLIAAFIAAFGNGMLVERSLGIFLRAWHKRIMAARAEHVARRRA